VNVLGLATVSNLREEAGLDAPLGNIPAQQAYDRLRGMFARDEHHPLALPVYRLPLVDRTTPNLLQRAASLGLASGDTRVRGPLETVTFRHLSFSWNRESGAERFVDRSRFHNATGNIAVLDEAAFMSHASGYLRYAFPSILETEDLYPYRVRWYKSAVAHDQEEPVVTTYQGAVAFNTAIEGIPVIGSGGKIAIHMAPNGDIVSHEATVVAPGHVLAIARGEDILPPTEARQRVEARLKGRGVDLSRHELARSEFGYLRRGRNNIQRILAPHYAFFFNPLAEARASRVRVETILATNAPEIVKAVDDDYQADVARKAAVMGDRQPDIRP